MADVGHNGLLKSVVERVENIEATIKEHRDEIKEIMDQAKADGLETKIIRNVLRLRKLDAEAREHEMAVTETYMHALGMLADTPLGQHAIEHHHLDLDVRKSFLNRT